MSPKQRQDRQELLSRFPAAFFSNKPWLLAGLVAVAWLVFVHRHVRTPWLWGIDPYTRLYHIDQTLIVVKGNAWLPLLQLVLQGVHFFSDTFLAYKLTMSLLSATGIFFFFWVMARWLGLAVALGASSFFFVSGLWNLVATSLYMEPLLLLFVSAAFLFHGRPGGHNRVASSLCLLSATFCRPEMLMASPLLVAGHYFHYRRWSRTAIFAAHFVPVAIFYVAMRLALPHFDAGGTSQGLPLLRRFSELADAIAYSPVTTAAAVLGLLGAVFVFQRDVWLSKGQKKTLGLMALGLPLYLVVFSFGLPADYSFRPRFSLQFVLPLFVLAAFCLESLRRQNPRILTPVCALVLVTAGILAYRGHREQPPPAHWAVTSILEARQRLGFPEDAVFALCRPDPRHTREDPRRHIDQVALLGATLRLSGFSVSETKCLDDSPRGEREGSPMPVLRVWRPDLIEENYEHDYTRGCRFQYELRHRRRVEAKLCF
ncbi:MAG: hypothetical protein MUC50_12340 [Myxococcota bacterium]|jgi:hypothetical protein|nr:hypothetical protein [Myxococcota bacterium]